MSCLLTGASGFIGGRIAERILAEGHSVRCLVRPTSDTSRLEQLGAELIEGDLASPNSLVPAVAGCLQVIHCAAMVSDWATVQEIRRVNVLGTKRLVQAAAASSVRRFVHLSTTDVYGYPGGHGIDETQPPERFRNWYAQSKLDAERKARQVAEASSLELVILRPATVYGPGSTEVVGEMAKAIRGRHMVMIGGGRAVAGLTYVENLVDATILALGHPAAPGQAFNVTDELPITWRRFLDDLADGLGAPRVRWSLPYGAASVLAFCLEHGYRLLRKATGLRLPALLSRQAVHVLGRPQDFSSARARAVLGWEPRVDYPAGLAATLSWLRADF